MARRPQLIPWKSAGLVSERQTDGDEVVRQTGWVFNNERGAELTLEEFVATGDAEVGSYLTIFGLRTPDMETRRIVEIGCGIGRMTCAFTREYGQVVGCDLDAGFLERCIETVGRFGRIDRLQTSHVADGKTLDLAPDSADVTFSYITFQHCDPHDALDLTAEAVRVTKPGGKVVLNYRTRTAADVVLLPMSSVMRALFHVPALGPWLSRQRAAARIGWQANRLTPDEIIAPLAAHFSDVEVWCNSRAKFSGRGATTKHFDGINSSHYWVIATIR